MMPFRRVVSSRNFGSDGRLLVNSNKVLTQGLRRLATCVKKHSYEVNVEADVVRDQQQQSDRRQSLDPATQATNELEPSRIASERGISNERRSDRDGWER
jgi:hypothetical protein